MILDACGSGSGGWGGDWWLFGGCLVAEWWLKGAGLVAAVRES